TEVTVTSRSGDRCVVRMVHSLFTDRDDWDDELESFETGWPGFFEVLRLYLRAFPGQPAANVVAAATHPGDMAHAWSDLAAALGVAGVDVSQRCESRSGAPKLAGWVERIEQKQEFRDVMVRLEAPCPGIAVMGGCVAGGQTRVMVSLYLYGDSAADTAAAEAPKWRAWMAQLVDAESAAT
ncbi:ATPase, partial [Mycobacterium sp. ITM-2017-0098]